MGRFPNQMEQAYLQHESEERFRRVEVVMERRRRDYNRNKPLPTPITDRDPGDEQD